MFKHKHGYFSWNRALQAVLIALIIIIVVSKFNLWAFWWIPFVFICLRGCSWGRRHRWHKHHGHWHHRHGRWHDDDDDDVEYV